MTAPLVVTAEFSPADFAFFDGERRANFPPERNQLPAHLTLFHALPPSIEAELLQRLAGIAAVPRPAATIAGLRSLGGGIAYVIHSPGLEFMREEIAAAFLGCLTSQDAQGWRAHVTIQNKVEPRVARALLAEKEATFRPRPVVITGLALHLYRGGPWEFVQRWRFRGA